MKKILYFIIPVLLVIGCKKEEKIDKKVKEAKARTHDFSLTFSRYEGIDSYMDFPYYLPGDQTMLVFLRDQTSSFRYHAMPYIDLDKGHLYSYSATDTGGLVWCEISDLNATYQYGSISPAITRNFRAVIIPVSQMRMSKELVSYTYAELKELYNLED